MIDRGAGSGAVSAVSRLLLWLNAIVLVGSYFAIPAYQKMNPGDVSTTEFVIFELLAAIDIAAAILVIKGHRWTGIWLIVATSTVWCTGSIGMQLASSRPLSEMAVLGTVAVTYWDAALLILLVRRADVASRG